jgi:chemotaxis protein methyltransferase CheR
VTIDGDLAAAIEVRTGLAFRGHQRARMLQVVAAEQRRLGCPEDRDYTRAVMSDDATFGALVDRLVVGETYFFRDPNQMELVRAVFARLARASAGPVRVWSAGCASGEEAYTLAVLGLEAGLGERLRVLGTDVSPAAIERARLGTYSPWSFRAVDEAAAAGWFDPADRSVRPEIAARVQFRTENLLHGPPGRFHLVLCRNVLMYLTPDAVRRTAQVLASSLELDGHLVIGASDPLPEIEGLVRDREPQGIVYRNPSASGMNVAAARAPAERPSAPRSGPPVAAPSAKPTRTAPAAASRPIVARAEPAPPASRVRALVEEGNAPEARKLLATAIADDPLDPELRCLAATLLLDGSDPSGAAREARAALYLDPHHAVAHVLLAHAQRALGRTEAADREYRRAASVLAQADPADAREADGTLSALLRQLTERADHG